MAEEDPLIADALAKLEAEDVEAARDAEAAFGWLTWAGVPQFAGTQGGLAMENPCSAGFDSG